MYEIRRKDRAKDENFALQLFKECEYAVLATVNADNSPYCIAVSPALDGRALYFHCAPEGQKIDNIRRSPQVCLTCIGPTQVLPKKLTTLYSSAVAYGTAEIIENEAEKIAALRLISQKYTPNDMEIAEKGIQASLHRTAVCRIAVTQATGKQRS